LRLWRKKVDAGSSPAGRVSGFAAADDCAAALGMRVARVLRVSERGQFEMDSDNSAIVVTGSRIPPTPLAPGEIPVRVTVWIDYALVPR
jgi:uncharacterized protein YggE